MAEKSSGLWEHTLNAAGPQATNDLQDTQAVKASLNRALDQLAERVRQARPGPYSNHQRQQLQPQRLQRCPNQPGAKVH
jgi:hypothetical protein